MSKPISSPMRNIVYHKTNDYQAKKWIEVV